MTTGLRFGVRTGVVAVAVAVADVTGADAEVLGVGVALAPSAGADALAVGAAEAEGPGEALGPDGGGALAGSGDRRGDPFHTTATTAPIASTRRPRTAMSSAA